MLTIGATAHAASNHCQSISETLEQRFEREQVLDSGEPAQTLTAEPVSGGAVASVIDDMARQQWTDQDVLLTPDELAPLAHVPEADEITTPSVNWSQAKLGDGVPPGTPRFDFDSEAGGND